jgi:hypothetical protein
MDRNSANRHRWMFGLAIWLLAGGFGVWRAEQSAGNPLHNQVISLLWHYGTSRTTPVDFKLEEPAFLAVGDPIFLIREGVIEQVGQVSKVLAVQSHRATRSALANGGKATFFSSTPQLSPGAELSYYSSGDSLQWVLQTMLPPEKRALVARELSAAFEEHRAEVFSALRPVLEASLTEAMLVLEEDLKAALAAQREDWIELGGKFQHEIVQRQLAPLMRKEIWPIVAGHLEPVANEVGKEMWERASLWRFGWRSAYDRLLMAEQPLMRQEWARFVREDAFPVLEKRAEEFVQLQQKILADIARNPQVRAAIRDGIRQMVDDPAFQQLAWDVLSDVIIQNARLGHVLAKHWSGAEAQRAFQIAAERVDPTVGRIAELLFGSAEQGITPEFARVLRSKVLGKDRRWLVLEAAANADQHQAESRKAPTSRPVLTVRPGGAAGVNPFDLEHSRRTHAARP